MKNPIKDERKSLGRSIKGGAFINFFGPLEDSDSKKINLRVRYRWQPFPPDMRPKVPPSPLPITLRLVRTKKNQ